MRLIDADALKNEFVKVCENLYANNGITMPTLVFTRIVDNAPAVCGNNPKWCESCISKGKCASTRPQGEWIPVSERLPEEKLFNPSGSDFGFDFDEVLCTTIWGDVRAYKFGKPIGHDKPHFWLGGGIMDEYVIAWQYKPEPYKEEVRND